MFRIIIYTLILGSLFIPRISLAGIWIGLDDILIITIGTIFILLKYKKILTLCIPLYPIIIFIIIYIPIGILQSYSYLNDIIIGTEIWQHIKRIITFLIFAYIGKYENEKILKKTIYIFLIVLILYQLIGLLQIISGNIGIILSEIYSRTEKQLDIAMNTFGKRIFGIAGFSTAWGGFSGFSLFAIHGLFTLLTKNNKSEKTIILKPIVSFSLVLCIINIYYSGSRSAIIASFIAIVFYLLLTLKEKPFFLIKKTPIIILISLGMTYFIIKNIDNFEFIIYRFSQLSETGGGGRDNQVTLALTLINTLYEWTLGISNNVQRTLGISHGIEIEYINILVNYGVIGLILLYSSLLILYFSLNKYKYNINYLNIYISGKAIIILYLVFSAGYFFFAELIVGTIPWAYFGLIYGFSYNLKNKISIKNPTL